MARPEPSFDRVASFPALVTAAGVASRGHRRSPEVVDFLLEVEQRCLALERELNDRRYLPGGYRTFHIRDPKPRLISAAPFRDRVVHHALCAEIEPALERGAAPESFACRRGKGTLAALRHARAMARRFRYSLKLDVRHFFQTARHDVWTEAHAPAIPAGPRLPVVTSNG